MKDLPITDKHRLDFYQSKVTEAERNAEAAKDSGAREAMLQIAKSWQTLADHITRTGKL